MADLMRWTPFEDLQRMRDELGRFFGAGWAPFGAWGPSVDVRETPTHFMVSAEVPGVDPN